jgi:hypothetical protein
VITLRHHLLTIVAVFLALAAGIVLGGGPLSDGVARTSARSTSSTTQPEVAPQAAYAEDFAAAVAPSLVAGRLADRQVAVVTVPGADERVVTGLVEQVVAAGGSVSTRVRLTDALVDPAQKSLVDTLGSQLLTQQGDAVDADASTYDRMGQLLGLAVATTTPEGEDVTGKSRAVTEAAAGAELVEPIEDVERRAPLVLLVLGPDAADPGSDAILAGLAAGLGRQAAGIVVAGTVGDGGDGQLGRLRADPVSAEITTVDGIDTPGGRAAAMLALARALETKGGAFGASGADGPVPLG